MPNETRVNLLHLLEDIRDSYALPIEEVIVTELVANALDSKATRIEFFTDPDKGYLRCVDNGHGMRRQELKSYHDIAATTKERGQGIGFAGVGAKLSLLVGSKVMTETRGAYRSRAATEWHLAKATKAPWKFIPSPGNIDHARGTAITITLKRQKSKLSDPEFIKQTIEKHFYPLLNKAVMEQFLHFFYPHGMEFFVNGQAVQLPISEQNTTPHYFNLFLGSSRRPIGFGYLVKTDHVENQQPTVNGLAISTYGKIIKKGWEWLGIFPKSYDKISGVVEIPSMSELLTTNKTDFLSDARSLTQYYRYRKAIQEAILPVMQELGEENLLKKRDSSKQMKNLSRQIEKALGHILDDFPELSSLIGVRQRRVNVPADLKIVKDNKKKDEELTELEPEHEISEPANTTPRLNIEVDIKTPPDSKPEGDKIDLRPSDKGLLITKARKKTPGLKIAFQDFNDPSPLGRMVEDTVWINTSHPAWKKARDQRLDKYHILVSIAWVLSQFLEEDRSSQDFISKFLSMWAKEEKTDKQGAFVM